MERFGRYVLLQQVGKGGMAEVYRAAVLGAAGFSRQVAVKRILPHFTAVKAFVDMFVDEARIASQLNHPNVLPVLDLGVERGTYFMAMEYVAGVSWRAAVASMAQARTPPRDALALHVAQSVLEGLHYAHTRRDSSGVGMDIVHRDVSPHNVMLGFDGRVVLGDFGIARARDRLVHSVTGTVKGKFGYMAPEQVLGQVVDARVDLYGVGASLYEALAHRRFRVLGAAANILTEVAHGKHVPLSRVRPDLPADACALVERAVDGNPDRRFSSAREFSAAVGACADLHGWQLHGRAVADLLAQLFPARRAVEEEAAALVDRVVRALARGEPGEGDLGLAPLVDDRGPVPLLPDVLKGATVAELRGAAEPEAPPVEESTLGSDGDFEGGDAITEHLLNPARNINATTQRLSAPLDVLAASTDKIPAPFIDSPTLPERTHADVAPVAPTATATAVPAPSPAAPSRLGLLLGALLTFAAVAGATVGTWRLLQPAARVVDVPPPAAVKADAAVAAVALENPGPEAAPAPAETSPRPRKDAPRTPRKPAPVVAETGTGFLSVQTYPWASIRIDGVALNTFTPLLKHPLPAGKHVLELENSEEKIQFRTEVTVRPNQVTQVTRRFTR